LTRIEGPGIDIKYKYQNTPGLPIFLTEVIPPLGNSWHFTYNKIYFLDSVESPYGGIISYPEYTLRDYRVGLNLFKSWVLTKRTVSGRDLPSGTWIFSYSTDSSGDTTTIYDPCGRTITYKHVGYNFTDKAVWKIGLLLEKSISGEETVKYIWTRSEAISYEDEPFPYSTIKDYSIWVPLLASKTILRDGQSYSITFSNYDSYGNPQLISETGDLKRDTSISYWYNPSKYIIKGKPAIETITGDLPGSFTTSYSYDDNGRLIELNKYGVITKYSYYTNGNLESVTDANGNTISYSWTNGSISKITNPIYSIIRTINIDGTTASETNGRGYTTYYYYDDNRRLIKIQPPLGNPTNYSYPADNSYRKETRGGYYIYYYYDGHGRPTGSLDSKGARTYVVYKTCGLKSYTDSNIGDKTIYDNLGRVKKIVHKDSTEINYSYSGSNLTITDEDGKIIELTYMAFGNPDEKMLFSVKDPTNNVTVYERNMLGSLTKISQGGFIRTFSYNSKNFLVSEEHPETGKISYGRDYIGNMISKTDGMGTKSYYYDSINRLIRINYGTGDITFSYDNADNRVLMDSPSAKITYKYDANNRLTEKTETVAGLTYTTKYEYDNNDNLIRLTYPSGKTITYSYNSNNQVIGIDGFGGSINSVTYNSAGLPTSYTSSNGLTTNITYNQRNLITRIKVGSVFDNGYGYDSRGNTISLTDNLNPNNNQIFAYDSLSRLITFNGPWGTGSFTYDPIGNRLTKKIGSGITSYNYSISTNRVSSASGAEPVTFSYNTNGNVITANISGVVYTLTYDNMNNLTGFFNNGNPVAQFYYDGDGMRIIKADGIKTIIYHYDKNGKLISENYSSGEPIADYVYLGERLVAKVVATPEISITPNSKDFGQVELGNNISQAFTITNKGSTKLFIDNISLNSDTDFYIKNDNCSAQALSSGKTCSVEITFSPSGLGLKNSLLTIRSNDPDSGVMEIPVRGTGIARLTVIKSGNGIGTVLSEPSGISCGKDCEEIYTQSTTVTLSAIPDDCSDFAGWKGENCNGTDSCIVTIENKNIIIEAVFNYKSLNADFTAVPISGSAPLIVRFTDQSYSCPEAWSWDFGDGSGSTIQNPEHIYAKPGTYTVTLTVSNSRTSSISTKVNYITIDECKIPVRVGISNPTYFYDIQSAYDSAIDGSIIQSIASDFIGDFNIHRDINIMLEGGFDCEFTRRVGASIINGNMSVTNGSTTIDNFILK